MTIADRCPGCGSEVSEVDIESRNYVDGIYQCEDLYCDECGAQVGGFAVPIHVGGESA